LTAFKGNTISLAGLKGKPIVINFWASWCPPCRIEAQLLERTWRAYKDRAVVFIGVDIQDKEEDALNYIREFDITYPNAPDPTGEVSIDYGVSGLPVTFFISRKGEIVSRWVGAIEKKVLISSTQEMRWPFCSPLGILSAQGWSQRLIRAVFPCCRRIYPFI
jgi:cytochrome c biogenesis protein CcmG/thiol:disulfide interchange protein DsbE